MTLDYLRAAIRRHNQFLTPDHVTDAIKLGPKSRKHQCGVDGCRECATAYVSDTYRSNVYFCSSHYIRATIPALDVS